MAYTTSLLRSETPLVLTATLSRRLPYAVVAQWRTVDGTALAGTDFVGSSGTITIDAGDLTASVSVTLTDYNEAPEAGFEVEIYSVTGARLNTAATAEVTLEGSPFFMIRTFVDETIQSSYLPDDFTSPDAESNFSIIASPNDANGWNPSAVGLSKVLRLANTVNGNSRRVYLPMDAAYHVAESGSWRASWLGKATQARDDCYVQVLNADGSNGVYSWFVHDFATSFDPAARDTSNNLWSPGGIAASWIEPTSWVAYRVQYVGSTNTLSIWAKRMSNSAIIGPYSDVIDTITPDSPAKRLMWFTYSGIGNTFYSYLAGMWFDPNNVLDWPW